MPLPKNRSNSVRKIKYRSPTGKQRIRYRRRVKGKTHSCAISGTKLQGTHSSTHIAKSSKRPNRIYGGHLSAATTKRLLILKSRLDSGEITLEDIDMRYVPYLKGSSKAKK